MATNRNKPAVGLTLDRDVVDWINSEAQRRRLKPSQLVNSWLAERKAADEAAAGQNCKARPCATNVKGRKVC
jgi:hypothetical protein